MPPALTELTTEQRNAASEQIDTLSTLAIVTLINEQDQTVAHAVQQILPAIARAVDLIAAAFRHGGRLIYCGAGTSGRLGVLDASECPPTFGTAPEQVIGLIAGGRQAMFRAVEQAEDNAAQGANDLQAHQLTARDVVVGIAASGRTPYVCGALDYARQIGATTIALACNRNSLIGRQATVALEPIVGPEVIAGSSRLKAGTAQKMVLNMLTTAAMIRIGKVYGNLMVDVVATNQKLAQRQIAIVQEVTGCDEFTAQQALQASDQHCKTAIMMILGHCDAPTARARLERHQGMLRQALADEASAP